MDTVILQYKAWNGECLTETWKSESVLTGELDLKVSNYASSASLFAFASSWYTELDFRLSSFIQEITTSFCYLLKIL